MPRSQRSPAVLRIFAVIAAVTLWIVIASAPAHAALSVPHRMVYNARLLRPNGSTVTTEHRVRFSFWIGADAVPSDLTGSGTINLFAPNFVGWKEEQTFTPDASGYFFLEIGKGNPLPGFESLPPQTLSNLHLQVEVKPATAADTSYEILDPHPLSQTVDRSPVLSVPFALNADRVDQREVGTGSGAIPLLGSGGVLRAANAPGATNANTFLLDADGNAGSAVALQFGKTLNKTLRYDVPGSRFIFNANLRVEGDLTVTGLVNGVDLATLGGTGSIILHPVFPGAAYRGDGQKNVGQMTVLHDATTKENAYAWTSTRSSLQDYDILYRATVPRQFSGWRSVPLRLRYRTTSGDPGMSALDVSLSDTVGNPVTTSGSTQLAGTSWATTQITWSGTPVWTPGQHFLIKITPYARNGHAVQIGTLEMLYDRTP